MSDVSNGDKMRQHARRVQKSEMPKRYRSFDAASSRTTNVVDLIDSGNVSFYQKTIVFLCFLVLAADGFDAGSIGYISPSLVESWGIPRAALGPVMSASLVGLGLGALVAGPIGDRIGRKAILVASVGGFGLFSLLAAQADSVGALIVLRFFTGIGLGAAMPNALTLTSEYSPSRVRSILVCAMNCGYSSGLVAGGMVSGWLIPQFGWRIVLIIGGIAPMALALLLVLLLPESMEFLAMRRDRAEAIAKIIRRISPDLRTDGIQFVVASKSGDSGRQRTPLALLLERQYRLGTIMLWLAYFMGLMIYYLLINWLPTLMKDSGFSMRDASWMTSMFPLGGIVGTVCVGWLMDRIDAARVIAATFGLTAALVAIAGSVMSHQSAIGILLSACGALLISAPTAMAALAVRYYPTQCRATGVSWMQGIGRLGGVAGAAIGAILLSTGWNLSAIFGFLALPAIVAGVATYIMSPSRRREDAVKAGFERPR
jgi:MFS transporter, AAHS family, 4-hydroxybenzoate transporter